MTLPGFAARLQIGLQSGLALLQGAARDALAWLRGLRGWSLAAVMAGLGAIMAMAMAPTFFFWLLPLCMGPLLIVWHEAASWRAAFARLWWFSFGYFVAGLYWIGIAVTTDWKTFWWFLPVPVILLPAFLALLQAGGGLLAYLGPWRRDAWASTLSFAAAWLLVEWVKLWLFTGFPWNLLGYSFAFTPWLMQPASLGGIWLLSTVALLFALLPWVAALGGGGSRGALLGPLLGPLLGLVVLGGNLAFSGLVLVTAPSLEALTEGQGRVALIQPNAAQGVLQTPEQQQLVIERMLRLSRAAIAEASAQPDADPLLAVIWPEAAVPDVLHRRPALQGYLARILPPDTKLITGSLRVEAGEGDAFLYYNAFDVLDHQGRELAYYNKRYLVPFGEYVPFKSLLDGIPSVTGGIINTSSGSSKNPIKVRGLPAFLPSICYEGIVPNFHSVGLRQESAFILNLTNDGWFGLSTGPHQHLAIQRTRAVEAGKPLVRVSNPGISSIFDGLGRQLVAIDLGVQSYKISRLPRSASKMTVFTRFGNGLALALIALLIFVATILISRQNSSSD